MLEDNENRERIQQRIQRVIQRHIKRACDVMLHKELITVEQLLQARAINNDLFHHFASEDTMNILQEDYMTVEHLLSAYQTSASHFRDFVSRDSFRMLRDTDITGSDLLRAYQSNPKAYNIFISKEIRTLLEESKITAKNLLQIYINDTVEIVKYRALIRFKNGFDDILKKDYNENDKLLKITELAIVSFSPICSAYEPTKPHLVNKLTKSAKYFALECLESANNFGINDSSLSLSKNITLKIDRLCDRIGFSSNKKNICEIFTNVISEDIRSPSNFAEQIAQERDAIAFRDGNCMSVSIGKIERFRHESSARESAQGGKKNSKCICM